MLAKFLIIISLIFCFISCEKDETGFGNYLVGVSNSTAKSYEAEIFLDGQSKGTFIIQASQQGNYSSRCNDLIYAATLKNVKILSYVSSGKHTLELKNSTYSVNKFSALKYDFTMKANGCISQQIDF